MVYAVIVTAVALTLAWPIRWFLGADGAAWSNENLTLTLMVAGLALATSFIVAFVVLAFRVPTLLVLAQRCDHALGEKQRLSTAFEVLMNTGKQQTSLIRHLLLTEVEQRLPTLRLSEALRGATPRASYPTLVGMLAVASLAMAVPVPQAPEPVTPTEATIPTTYVLTPESVDETIELAETIAQQLEAEPIAERDPFLRAVAEGFAELALQLREESIDVEEANQIVDDLLSFLEDAVERTGGSLEEAVLEAMPEGIDRGRGEDSNASIPSFGGDVTEGEEGDMAPERVDNRPDQASANAQEGSALERLAEALERRAEERAANALEGPTETFGADGRTPYGDQVNVVRESTGEAEPGMEPLMRADAGGAGRAAGAAEQSSAAAGDAAGGGSAELEGATNDFARDDAQVELTPIEAGDVTDGQRIEMSLAPTEGLLSSRIVTEAPPERAFDRTNEQGAPSQTLGWTQRDVVRRYFLPQAAQADSDAP